MKHPIDQDNFRLNKANGTVSFLVGIDLGKAEVSVSIPTGLLIDSTQALDGSHIEDILAEQLARTERLNMSFFFLFCIPEIPLGDNRVI